MMNIYFVHILFQIQLDTIQQLVLIAPEILFIKIVIIQLSLYNFLGQNILVLLILNTQFISIHLVYINIFFIF